MKRFAHRLSEFLLRYEIVVLCYHGVADIDFPFRPWTQLSVGLFEEQMELLARSRFNVLPLSQLVRTIGEGESCPPNTVAITFDDGFRNNVRNAVPILKRLRLPATFFLAADLVGGSELIWSDKLAAGLMATDVELLVDEQLGEFPVKTSQQRAAVYRRIVEFLKPMSPDDKNRVLERVLARLSPRSSRVAIADLQTALGLMTWEEAREISATDLFEIGGHSCRHEILTRMPEGQIRQDVRSCKKLIEEQLEQPAVAFAYPNGGPGDFDETCISALRDAGWKYAVTAVGGRLRQGTDMYRIPRLLIGADSSAESLRYALSGTDTIRRRLKLRRAIR